eukprot:scaffold119649_cov15-Prasinocladus_malaysianus.AAC.1
MDYDAQLSVSVALQMDEGRVGLGQGRAEGTKRFLPAGRTLSSLPPGESSLTRRSFSPPLSILGPSRYSVVMPIDL